MLNAMQSKIWVYLTIAQVHIRKIVRRTSPTSAKSYSKALFLTQTLRNH